MELSEKELSGITWNYLKRRGNNQKDDDVLSYLAEKSRKNMKSYDA